MGGSGADLAGPTSRLVLTSVNMSYKDDLLYQAWTVIANAGGGDWDKETPEWKEAAEKWRDAWHQTFEAARD